MKRGKVAKRVERLKKNKIWTQKNAKKKNTKSVCGAENSHGGVVSSE